MIISEKSRAPGGGAPWAERTWARSPPAKHIHLMPFHLPTAVRNQFGWPRSRSCSDRWVHGCVFPGRNAHIRSSTVVYVRKSHDRKNSQKLVRTRKWDFCHRNTLLYVEIVFWNFVLALHEKRIQLFNSVNNSECMKQHCTSPLMDFFINRSHLVEWTAQLSPSSWILTHLQETAKNTSVPSLFHPLILALSILILFCLSVFFFYKLHTLDPLSIAYYISNC